MRLRLIFAAKPAAVGTRLSWIKQNYKLIPEKSLVGLAVSKCDADTVEFVQSPQANHQSIDG